MVGIRSDAMDQTTIRRRLSALRERRDVNQADLATGLGFNDRQTLSEIEMGRRNVAPAELARAAEFFNVSVDYFTDPLELAGEACFSWRKSPNDKDDLESFENQAGRWIATYRHLSRLKGDSINSSLTRVGLTIKSSFEEAIDEGDAVSRALELGDIPATALTSVLEEKLDTLVLLVDTIPGVSGAACQLGPLNTIIINRREVEGRRSFDMGHELFHLITWVEMPPPHINGNGDLPPQQKRVEQLANNFSSGLLMPRHAVENYVGKFPLPDSEDQLPTWIREAAFHFHVSGQALKWRLVTLNMISRAACNRIDDAALQVDPQDGMFLPARFSNRFVSILGWGIDEGHLSVRKAADVVGITVDDLADLFSEHGLKTPFHL